MKTLTRLPDLWLEFVDRDMEALANGRSPVNTDLEPVSEMIHTMTLIGGVPHDPALVSDYAAIAARNVRMASQSPAVDPRPALRRGLDRMGNLARSAAASTVLVAGMTGVAVASNDAVPGDWNYSVDLYFEQIGIGDGGISERIDELAQLNSRGDSQSSLMEAAEQLRAEMGTTAVEAVLDAADRVTVGQNTDVRQDVEALLDYLAENRGEVDGKKVSELAKQIGADKSSAVKEKPADAPPKEKPKELPPTSRGNSKP